MYIYTPALPPGEAHKLMHTDPAVNWIIVNDVIDNFCQKNNIFSCQVQVFHHRDVSKSLNLFGNICLYVQNEYSREFFYRIK